MGHYLMLVQGAALPGREEELRSWYDEVHFPEICAIPGVKNARRYTPTPDSPVPWGSPNLAIYEVETDDFGAVTAELRRRTVEGEMTRFDGLDRKATKMFYFEMRGAGWGS